MDDLILDDGLLSKEIKLVPASKGKRFANFIIDYILSIILMGAAFVFLDLMRVVNLEEDSGSSIVENVVGLIVYVLFYIGLEGGLNGKTIGKYITGTRAVSLDGTKIEFGNLLKRSFSRLVPFEAFSFLGDAGWHDSWSDTMVIDEKVSVVPDELDL